MHGRLRSVDGIVLVAALDRERVVSCRTIHPLLSGKSEQMILGIIQAFHQVLAQLDHTHLSLDQRP